VVFDKNFLENYVLGRVFPNWKRLVLCVAMLVGGFFVGEAYRGAIENERLEALMSVSERSLEVSTLDGASMLLMAMKSYSPDCARSMVQIRLEQGIIRARASIIPGHMDVDLDKAIKRAIKALQQKDKSGLDFSRGCTVPYK